MKTKIEPHTAQTSLPESSTAASLSAGTGSGIAVQPQKKPDPSVALTGLSNKLSEQSRASAPSARTSIFKSSAETAPVPTLNEQLKSIASGFENAKTETERKAAADKAITFYTTNSNSINKPLRNGDKSPLLDAVRRAIDHGIKSSPDYGKARPPLDRLVNFPKEFLVEIINGGELRDPAFTSTDVARDAPRSLSMMNTVLHIEANFAAYVNDRSPNKHFNEHLLPSNSVLELVKGHFEKVDEDDPLHDLDPQAVRAELWLRQVPPADEDLH